MTLPTWSRRCWMEDISRSFHCLQVNNQTSGIFFNCCGFCLFVWWWGGAGRGVYFGFGFGLSFFERVMICWNKMNKKKKIGFQLFIWMQTVLISSLSPLSLSEMSYITQWCYASFATVPFLKIGIVKYQPFDYTELSLASLPNFV